MKRLSYYRREQIEGLMFIMPALVLFLVFLAYPIGTQKGPRIMRRPRIPF